MSATGEGPPVSDAGSTLLEMLVVVALLSMTIGLAFPVASGCYDRLAADVARGAVTSDLRAARSLAIERNQAVSLQVFEDGRRYRVDDRDVLLPAGVRLNAEPARVTFFPGGVDESARLSIAPRRGQELSILVEAPSGLVRPSP